MEISFIRSLAHKIHSDVNQMYDSHPYGYHLDMVADNAIKYMDSSLSEDEKNVIIFGAFFHDTIEDARLTYNDVLAIASEHFPNRSNAINATEIVYALTNEKGRNREARTNDKYYKGIRITRFASYVKLCDRLANMQYSIDTKSKMAKKYLDERTHFIKMVNNGDKALEPIISAINALSI